MAANGQFKNDAEEYAFVLNNTLLFDAIFNEFDFQPVSEYGSYNQVNPWMRTQIMNWLHKQDFYWDEVFGLNEGEDVDDEEDGNVVAQPNVVEQPQNVEVQQPIVEEAPRNVVEEQVANDICLTDDFNLEKRIRDLEIIFQHLKEKKDKEQRGQREESMEESSGSNVLGA